MSTLSDSIARDLVIATQLERQRRARELQEQKNAEKINTRRKIIIGGLVTEYFPETLSFTPRRTKAENSGEFAPLANLLAALASDRQYISQLKAHLHIENINEIQGGF